MRCSHYPADNTTRPEYCLKRETRQTTLIYDAVSKIAHIFCAQRKENGKAGYDNIERARKVLSRDEAFSMPLFSTLENLISCAVMEAERAHASSVLLIFRSNSRDTAMMLCKMAEPRLCCVVWHREYRGLSTKKRELGAEREMGEGEGGGGGEGNNERNPKDQ